MKRLVFIAAAALAAATSCQKETFESPEAQGDYIIKASAEGFASTRAAISDEGVFSWIDGEGIEVYNGSKFLPFYAQSSAASTTFSGTLSGTLQKCAFSPKGLNPSVDGTTLKVTLPSEYTWQEGQTNAAMIAEFNDISNGLTFAHLGGVVKIQLTGVPTTATKFTFTADKDITGEYTLTNDTDGKKIIAASTTSTGKNTVTINFKNETDGGTMDFYIPLPVGTYNQFKLGVYKADGNPVATVDGQEKARTIARKSLWKFNPVKVGTVKADGEGTPQDVVVPESHNGTFNLPATTATVNVYLEGNTHALDIVYAYGDGGYPEDVNIICKGNIGNQDAGTGLTVNLPKSHVTVSGNAESTVTINSLNSSTSNNTLVLGNTVKIADKLTVAKGSATIGCEVKNVTVAKKAQDDTSEGEVNITLADGAKVTDSLSVSQGNVAIEKGAEVAAVDVKESVGETATVTVASGASITKELKVAQAKSVEIAGTVPTVTVAATATSPVVTVAETAEIKAKLEVAKGSVDVAAKSKVKAVEVEATVSNVTIATAVETVTVKDATTTSTGGSAETAAPVIWVTETGSVTTAVKDSTTSGTSSVTVVAANGQAKGNDEAAAGQVKVVTDGSGSAKQDVVKTPLDFLKEKIENGGEITLEDNIAGNFEIKDSKSVTINLNGKTIKNETAANTFTVALNGKLTINGNGTVDNTSNRCAAIHNNGTLVLNGGTYTRSAEDGSTTNSYYTILNHGEMTVNSGVKVENKGTFSSTIASGYDTWKAGGATKYVYESNTNHQNPTLTINGGSITGGKYSVKHDGTDNTLTIATGVEIAKAKINGTIVAYVASNDALTAALNNESIAKIILTSDLKSANIIKPSRELVIDLGGHKLTAGNTVKASGARYETTYTAVVTDGVKVTVKNGTIGDDDTKSGFGVYSTNNEGSKTVLENITFGKSVIYAYNGGGELDATGCKFYGWLSGWNKGGKFTNCEFGVGKAYYPAAICYGSTEFSGCTFFKNGVDADEYGAAGKKDSDGYYRCNYVVSACLPAESISFTNCKYSDNTSVTGSNHPYHFKDCINGWGDGKAVSGTVTVDNAEVTSTCSDAVLVSNAEMLTKALANTYVKKITLGADITLTDIAKISGGREVVIDMNNHSVKRYKTPFVISHAKVEFTGTGTISETEDRSDDYALAPIRVEGATTDKGADYTVVTVGKDITLKGWSGIMVGVDEGGEGSYNNYGIVVNFHGKIARPDGFNSDEYGIYINGLNKKTTGNVPVFNLDGATIDVACAGIYAAGYAKWNIKNSTLTGAKETAIEIRAGEMTIENGTFTSSAAKASAKANGNGTTIKGAALAISQHTTDLDINVKVNGGTFKGVYALYEDDLQNQTGNVTVSVASGATLTGKVYSKNNSNLNTEDGERITPENE